MSIYEDLWRQMLLQRADDTSELHKRQIITAPDLFEHTASKYPDQLAVMSCDSTLTYTYSQLDDTANQVAHWAIAHSLAPGDVVALMMENRPEFLAITMGFAKVGVIVALLPTQIKEDPLFHALTVVQAKIAIVSAHFKNNFNSCLPFFEASRQHIPCTWWFGQLEAETKEMHDPKKRKVAEKRFDIHYVTFPNTRPEKKVRVTVKPKDTLFYFFTSGSSGVSKAARFSHIRFIGCALTWTRPCGLNPSDRYLISLPLYHSTAGCMAVAPCFFAGATLVLRDGFSPQNFFSDAKKFEITLVLYIGEFCRSLLLLPPSANENNHFIKALVGNGLSPEVWEPLTERYGIPLVVEHYGASEMPGDPILNYFNKVGSCGYVPYEVWKEKGSKIIRYDVQKEAIVRTKDGLCQECEPNETGEFVMKVPDGKYEGYLGEEANKKKVYLDVFEKGDVWWSSGDLLKIDDEGFLYFVERTGNTFRWKGENVSASEVAKAIYRFQGVKSANVYGVPVPRQEGKAGMACILADQSQPLDLKSLYLHLTSLLPSYAIPIFLRIKYDEEERPFNKFQCVQQGFNPNSTRPDIVYFLDLTPGVEKYIKISEALYHQLSTGALRF